MVSFRSMWYHKNKDCCSKVSVDKLTKSVYMHTPQKNTFWIVPWIIFLDLLCHFLHAEIAVNLTKLSTFLRKKKWTKKLNLKINSCCVSKLKPDRNCPAWHVFEFKLMDWVARAWAHKIIFFLLQLLLPYNQRFIFLLSLSFQYFRENKQKCLF